MTKLEAMKPTLQTIASFIDFQIIVEFLRLLY
jgi:hypothetical protein